MIEAPQSPDSRPHATDVPPNGPSKASMMIAAYRAARLNQRLNPRTAPVASIRVDGEANSPSPDASLGTPPAQDTVETSEPIMGGVNELMTAPAPLPDDVVVPSHPEPYIAHTEPMVDAEPARTEPALAEIGLGPSMLLRLNQIGLRSVHMSPGPSRTICAQPWAAAADCSMSRPGSATPVTLRRRAAQSDTFFV